MTPAIDPRHLAFLDTLESAELEHSNRKSRDHLIGVHALLAEWGCGPETCVAGLFHNIYGTESFKPHAVSLDRRGQVAVAIGEAAETLASWFCVSRRASFFTRQDAAAPCTWDEVHRRKVAVAPAQLVALIDIEAANLAEQYGIELLAHAERLAQAVSMMRWILAQPSAMSAAARRGLETLLQTIERDQRRPAAFRA